MTLGRRDFLRVAATAPLLGAGAPTSGGRGAGSCIVLVLTGGPSQVDTWDMKPDAPSEIRGPFRPIRTNVPGVEISEIFPRMARHADKYALVRSVYSDVAPVHEEALRELDAGPIGFMGGESSNESGSTTGSFSADCRRAVREVEAGVRFVRVPMFDSVFHQATWDSHGSRPFSSIRDYQESVAPLFDAVYCGLLEDLIRRGLLQTTLVVAMGEFGRTPRINPSGGRDHWTKCRTVIMAGGGIRGGQVYGSSDSIGAEPKEKPVCVSRIVATMRFASGDRPIAEPLHDLFA